MIRNKGGQLAVYVVIAIFIIGGIISFFVFREKITEPRGVPIEMTQVFDYYQSCIERETKNAIILAGSQGGRIEKGVYEPGSDFSPFSSHFNFFGIPVGYWYYLSGNGLVRENVPTLNEVEKGIERYVEDNLKNCDFEMFRKQGFEIKKGTPKVNIKIEDTKVLVNVDSEIIVSKFEKKEIKSKHNAVVSSKLGKFYKTAREIYDKEKREAFFEKYAVDVVYNYAPVDGVEIQCGPKFWSTKKVMDDIREGISQNFQTIKFKGKYYDLANKKGRDYFVVDLESDESVNVLYLKDWPTRIDIYGKGVDDELMVAESIGMQEGLGMMGFCYVPYHFVYDVKFPVLIQIFNNEELFQFPIVVVVDKNMPRKANLSNVEEGYPDDFDLCAFMNQQIKVSLYDINLNKVEGNVSYECFSQRCWLGQTSGGVLNTLAPSCLNGYLIVRADGFSEARELFSTNKETIADIILDREREVKVEVNVGGKPIKDNALVSFLRDDGKSVSISYPQMNSIKLSEGNYEVRVYVYGNTSITIPASTKYHCVNTPRGGILGLFGATKEECFDVTIPATNVGYSLVGGGIGKEYILDSELKKGNLKIDVDALPTPNSLDALAKNFELFESKKPRLNFYGR